MKLAEIDELAAPAGRKPVLEAVLALARRCGYERGHTHQVTRGALALFEELRVLHGMGAEERFCLQCGALLHDIGWCEGQAGHHKTAMLLILAAEELPLSRRRRALVAQIARYHRKALPSEEHAEYRALAERDRRRVDVLAGILRVADGLDWSHGSLLVELDCALKSETLTLRCRMAGPAEGDLAAAAKKADLLAAALGRKVVFEPTQP